MIRKLKRYIGQKWCAVTNTYWRTYTPFKSIKDHLNSNLEKPFVLPYVIIPSSEEIERYKTIYFLITQKKITIKVTKSTTFLEDSEEIESVVDIPLGDYSDDLGQIIETITALQETVNYLYTNRKNNESRTTSLFLPSFY
ncbi:MAG: hypothetical protein HC836_41235 [Richelia sp. RM2_1_2]|nr:hypothetical protein [Richelia sp. RM2_1_2]